MPYNWTCPCGTLNDTNKTCSCGIGYGSALYYMAKTERNTRTIKNIVVFWLVMSIISVAVALIAIFSR